MLQQVKVKGFIHSQGSSWRPEIPEGVRHRLTEEVSTANPSFPFEMFTSRLLKRRADHKQQWTAAGQSDCTEIQRCVS